jgi:hypothetical protein
VVCPNVNRKKARADCQNNHYHPDNLCPLIPETSRRNHYHPDNLSVLIPDYSRVFPNIPDFPSPTAYKSAATPPTRRGTKQRNFAKHHNIPDSNDPIHALAAQITPLSPA